MRPPRTPRARPFNGLEIVRTGDIARAAGVSRETVRRWSAQGRLPPIIAVSERVHGFERKSLEARLGELMGRPIKGGRDDG